MKATNIVGQTFGRLTVLSRAGSSAAGNVTWWCQCECGATTRSAGSDLRRGRTTSCGCQSAASTAARHARGRDLVGQTFGRLTVVSFAGLNGYPRATWLCLCECGTSCVITGHHLTSGDTVSCGCRGREVMAMTPVWNIKETVGYTAAHGRVKALHGFASRHRCADCERPAEDWSYLHNDPAELRDERGRPYSLTPSHYVPRCRSCHKNFDNTQTSLRRSAQGENKRKASA